MKEIVTGKEYKHNAEKEIFKNSSNRTQGCSFWNTYYVYSTGGSRSASASAITVEVEGHAELLSDCSAIGEPDTSCFWDNHFCVTTQAF